MVDESENVAPESEASINTRAILIGLEQKRRAAAKSEKQEYPELMACRVRLWPYFEEAGLGRFNKTVAGAVGYRGALPHIDMIQHEIKTLAVSDENIHVPITRDDISAVIGSGTPVLLSNFRNKIPDIGVALKEVLRVHLSDKFLDSEVVEKLKQFDHDYARLVEVYRSYPSDGMYTLAADDELGYSTPPEKVQYSKKVIAKEYPEITECRQKLCIYFYRAKLSKREAGKDKIDRSAIMDAIEALKAADPDVTYKYVTSSNLRLVIGNTMPNPLMLTQHSMQEMGASLGRLLCSRYKNLCHPYETEELLRGFKRDFEALVREYYTERRPVVSARR